MKSIGKALVGVLLAVSPAFAEPLTPTTTSNSKEISLAGHELQALVAQSLNAFASGKFTRALQGFNRVLSVTSDPEQRASLHFNAAACLLKLRRPDEAERRFLLVVEESAQDAALGRIQAGFAALAAQAISRAEVHFKGVVAANADERKLAQQLQLAIAEQRLEVESRERLKLLAQGYEQLGQEKLALAKLSFLSVLKLRPLTSERADALYGLALVAHRSGETSEALILVDNSLALDSQRYAPHWLRGVISLDQGKRQAAEQAWRLALALNPPASSQALLRTSLAQLDSRSPAGFSGGAHVAAGYDSNAAQSGSAVRVGLAATDDPVSVSTGSPIAEGQYYLSAEQHWGRRGSFRQQLSIANLAMSRSNVRDFSLSQAHLLLQAGYYPLPWVHTWLSLAGAHLRIGLAADTPFVSLVQMTVGTRLEASEKFQTRVSASYEVVRGLQQSAALTGYRLRGAISESYTGSRLTLELGAEVLLNSARRESLVADLALVPRCQNSRIVVQAICDTLRFDVPLSYRALSVHADTSYSLLPSILAVGNLGYQYRAYSEDAQLLAGDAGVVIPNSETRRKDHRMDVGLGLNWLPQFLSPWSLTLSYRAKIVVSNLRPDLDDSEHRYDYEDRNYTQHRALLGVRLRLP